MAAALTHDIGFASSERGDDLLDRDVVAELRGVDDDPRGGQPRLALPRLDVAPGGQDVAGEVGDDAGLDAAPVLAAIAADDLDVAADDAGGAGEVVPGGAGGGDRAHGVGDDGEAAGEQIAGEGAGDGIAATAEVRGRQTVAHQRLLDGVDAQVDAAGARGQSPREGGRAEARRPESAIDTRLGVP